eukprot:TRINITY_DN9483_c0_g1_i1.p1 TRINITY_DN9483_c0_g1~~TRINITY_DN9483_c0_g1_i1.p1  ORF type:complete len:319 (+),score=66.48 TRINITY_DN9483_c0_g1_i1:80-958(+)
MNTDTVGFVGRRSVWVSWFVWLRLQFHYVWILLAGFLLDRFTYSSSKINRKPTGPSIAIIGDGTAEGLGDWVVIGSAPGVANRLQHEFCTDGRPTFNAKDGLVVNSVGGAYTSEDWLPSQVNGPFEKCFGKNAKSIPVKEADIVCIHLGAYDYERSQLKPMDTIFNLRAIATELSSRGKAVYISTSIDKGHTLKGIRYIREVNQLLKTHLRDHSDWEGVRFGIDIGTPQYTNDLWIDETHLSSKGYKKLALAWKMLLHDAVVKLEWKTLKGKLAVGTPTTATPSSSSKEKIL